MVVVLPAPLGPRKPVTIAGLHVEAQIVDGQRGPIAFREISSFDHPASWWAGFVPAALVGSVHHRRIRAGAHPAPGGLAPHPPDGSRRRWDPRRPGAQPRHGAAAIDPARPSVKDQLVDRHGPEEQGHVGDRPVEQAHGPWFARVAPQLEGEAAEHRSEQHRARPRRSAPSRLPRRTATTSPPRAASTRRIWAAVLLKLADDRHHRHLGRPVVLAVAGWPEPRNAGASTRRSGRTAPPAPTRGCPAPPPSRPAPGPRRRPRRSRCSVGMSA